MASSITKAPLLRNVTTRGYCQLAPISGNASYEVKTTVLPNKLIVASAENESPISRVAIMFKAGSRNECYDSLGATHLLRVSAGLSTKNSSQFAITRNLQQVGASLSAMTDRESVAYILEGTRKSIEQCMPYLTDVATQQVFKPWEVQDNMQRLKLELASRPFQQRAVDLLHKAAYRRGLGNSIYIPKHQIGKISSETLQHYVNTNFKSNRAAVIGLGVDHGELVRYAQSLGLNTGSDEVGSSKYLGGEIRSDKGGDLAYIAIAGEGGSLKNTKESMAFAVLQRVLGAGSSVKYGNDQSLLTKCLGNSVQGEPHSITSLNVNYSDSGLFGVFAIGSVNASCALVEAAVKTLKGTQITDKDVARAKNQLKIDLLSKMENAGYAIDYIGNQALLVGVPTSPCQVEAAIDAITKADVEAAMKKVSASKLSIASVGNLEGVPFLDELK